jgi:hypothetical protein
MPLVTVPSWIRSHARAAAFALLTASLLCAVTSARAADGVNLTVKKGPGAGDLTLDWTGGQPTFDVYRSTSAAGLVAPGNLVTSTAARTLTTPQGPDTISFFIVGSPCVIDLPERCDGVDNDCNGVIDDPGAVSSCSLPNATPACVGGTCVVSSCDGGYANCDGAAANGCEVAVSSFPTDPANCGGCNNVCPSAPNAAAQCSASTCSLVCNPGYADCNINPTDGCEVNVTADPAHCGNCGNSCPFRPASTRTCVASACSYTCNGTFVDCNGLPADGCEVQANSFPSNSSNCGGCGIVCSLPNALGVCSASLCQSTVASCNAGFVDLNGNGADGCEYACTATGTDLPDDAFVDANCDGIDGDASAAVFVSPGGNDANPGTRALPMLTVSAALSLAATSGKSQVYLDQGLYLGTVQLVNGISLYGGYSSASNWSRSAANVSEIRGTTASGGALRGVVGDSLSSTTILDRLKITTSNATGAGVSTYALHCTSCPAIVVKNCTLAAGNAGPGSAGTAGTSGASGTNGTGGTNGACDTNVSAPGGGGGTSTCTRTGGSGGAGRYATLAGLAGQSGVGPTNPGNGGNAGDPGQPGQNGQPGAAGTAGTAGPGGSGGSIVAGLWVGSDGAPGANGNPGNGGGGGGGGGGQNCFTCQNGTGNGGGGGGGGGCGGIAGTGGTAGGGSFGAFFRNTTGFTIQNTNIQSGAGGAGGSGAAGGSGGANGVGGAGASLCSPAEVGRGGNGGNGGAGGASGASGGGAGGVSWAVYRVSSVGTITGGSLTAGFGGNGGTSPGNAGVDGASGTLF